jgi:hypothetical protein
MIKCVQIRVYKVMLLVGNRGISVGGLDMDLILIAAGHVGKRISEGADMVVDVIHAAKVQLDHLIPELGVCLDSPGDGGIHGLVVGTVGPHMLPVDRGVTSAHEELVYAHLVA